MTADESTNSAEYAELVALYEAIEADHLFVKELGPGPKSYMAAVGDVRDLEYLASIIEPGRTRGIHIGEVVSLAIPGTGATPADAIRHAWAGAQRARAAGDLPRFVEVRRRLGTAVREPTEHLGAF